MNTKQKQKKKRNGIKTIKRTKKVKQYRKKKESSLKIKEKKQHFNITHTNLYLEAAAEFTQLRPEIMQHKRFTNTKRVFNSRKAEQNPTA